MKICPIDLFKFKDNVNNFFYYCPTCMTYFINKVNLNNYSHIATHLEERGISTFQPIFGILN